MRRIFLLNGFVFLSLFLFAQADNEIQVYTSPTIQHHWTIFELHSNYTFKGSKMLTDPTYAHWTNETVEITHGFGKNFEIGFYTFTALSPQRTYQYLGNQVRPRVTVPVEWKWPFGASLSMELGFFRPDRQSPFYWQGELRPIIDKTTDKWYFAFNPNIEFVVTGPEKQLGLTPQFKSVYTIKQVFGIGFEYYSALGRFNKLLPLNEQEHLMGPRRDLYVDPKWEINTGFLFGLTDYSNHRIVKLLLGRRVGR
ncbi:MAG: hypothetical protein ICV51_01820 [Flavisolibacter sp.]|nr:hypothetical protein [Flavisolibacter sp.]